MKDKVIFCADGNAEIGSGHIMRCLSIADEANSRGIECIFITSSDEFTTIINHRGYRCLCTNTDYRKLDSSFVCESIRKYHPRAVIVDSYYVTRNYLESIMDCSREFRSKTAYVDDLLSFAYPCDVLINYNIYGSDREAEYKDLYSEFSYDDIIPQLLLGASYAPLRMEFQNLQPRQVNKNAGKILISTGGADNEHLALDLVKRVKSYQEYEFHFIIGSLNGDKLEIQKIASGFSNIRLHENVRDMSDVMKSVDVAISAAGSTLYELCATQTPTVTYILADNQILGAEGFKRHDVMESAGDIRKADRESFTISLIKKAIGLCLDYDRRIQITKEMSHITDGKGSVRIIDEILRDNV